MAGLVAFGIACVLGAGPAGAQMVLPGAVAPVPEGNAPAAAKAAPRRAVAGEAAPMRGTPVTVPGAGTLAGRTLSAGGGGSQITFATLDRRVAATRLSLVGQKIASPQDSCRIEASGTPLALSGLGRPDGLERFRLETPTCPIEFDVLDGAILVDRARPACEVVEADCRVPVAGLWGPAPADLGPDRVKGLERARGLAESAVRSNYKALVASTKDRPTIMGFARDQAQFSSTREEVCRDYADEGRHGFCATKLTEARAALLHDRLGTALAEKAARKAKRHGAR